MELAYFHKSRKDVPSVIGNKAQFTLTVTSFPPGTYLVPEPNFPSSKNTTVERLRPNSQFSARRSAAASAK